MSNSGNLFNNQYYQAVGNLLGLRSVDSDNDINRIRSVASSAGIGSIDSDSDVRQIQNFLSNQNSSPSPAPSSSSSSSTSQKPVEKNTTSFQAENPQDFQKSIRWNESDIYAGANPEFAASQKPSTKMTSISPLGLLAATENADKSWEYWKENKLTDLRGQISKELAQLYNATEIDKTKIVTAGAMDVQRQAGADNFRSGMKQSYSGILANMS
jgi:hypothetical protein